MTFLDTLARAARRIFNLSSTYAECSSSCCLGGGGWCMLVSQLCLTLCEFMDCSLPGSSVHGILQARILEWVAISFSRERRVWVLTCSLHALLLPSVLLQLEFPSLLWLSDIPLYICCWYFITKLCLTLCDPMNCSMPGFPVLHYLLEFAQIHVHWVSDPIQPSHPLSPPSLPTLSIS